MTVCGCFSALLIPMPFIFFFMGKKSKSLLRSLLDVFNLTYSLVRAKSKFAPAPDLKQEAQRRDEEAGGTVDQTNKENAEAPTIGMGSSDESTSEKKSVPS